MLDDGTLISGDSIMGEAVSLARLGPGKRVGPYLIISRLAVGDAGVRYRARDTRDESTVLLRLLRPERDQDELREDLERLAEIEHPHLADIHEVRLRLGVVCVAQRDVTGTALREWARGRPWPEIVAALVGVAEALATIHAAGHVYRELEPSKILVDSHGRATLASLRSQRERRPTSPQAQSVDSSTISRSSSTESLSSPLLLIEGCPAIPAYLAPEQYAGRPATPHSDQFSFCVLLYEALYGERPFAGRTIEGLFLHVDEGRLRPPPRRNKVPRRLREVLVRGLARDPAARWPDMSALVDALTPLRAPRRRLTFAVLAVLALVSLGALGLASALDDARPTFMRDCAAR